MCNLTYLSSDVRQEIGLDIFIEESTSITFTDVALTNSDFTFQSHQNSYEYEGSFPWQYHSNEKRGKCKISGKLQEDLPDGWDMAFILDPPEDDKGVFGRSEQGGKYIPISTKEQDYVDKVSKGRVGEKQLQHVKMRISEKAWDLATDLDTHIVILWTLSSS